MHLPFDKKVNLMVNKYSGTGLKSVPFQLETQYLVSTEPILLLLTVPEISLD